MLLPIRHRERPATIRCFTNEYNRGDLFLMIYSKDRLLFFKNFGQFFRDYVVAFVGRM